MRKEVLIEGLSHLFKTISLGDSSAASQLLQQSPDLAIISDPCGKFTALMKVAIDDNGDLSLFEALLRQGADEHINDQNCTGWSVLHFIAHFNRIRFLEHLIEKYKNTLKLDMVNHQKMTPIMLAANKGNHECLQKLMTAGVNLHITDDEGRTALHCACFMGHVECVKVLLQAGSMVNARDKKGRSPLHCASFAFLAQKDLSRQTDYLRVCELLIAFGADPSAITTRTKLTSSQIAKQSQLLDIAETLKAQEFPSLLRLCTKVLVHHFDDYKKHANKLPAELNESISNHLKCSGLIVCQNDKP